MLKIFLFLKMMLYAVGCMAGIDVNSASAADLDSIKGVGPALSGRILDERQKGKFKDWNDLRSRVKGIGEKSAVKFSSQGLTVNQLAYKEIAISVPASSTRK